MKIYILLMIIFLVSCKTYSNKDFFAAVYNNETKQIEKMIKSGVDVNSVDRSGFSALNYAISTNNYELFEILIKNGADITYIDDEGRSYLHVSVTEGDGFFYGKKDIRFIKYLLKTKKLDVNKQDRYGATPLHYSISPPQYEIMKLLLKYGAHVNILNDNKMNALHFVGYNYGMQHYVSEVGIDSLKIAKLLLKKGAKNPERVLEIITPMKKVYNAAIKQKWIKDIEKMEKLLRKYIREQKRKR